MISIDAYNAMSAKEYDKLMDSFRLHRKPYDACCVCLSSAWLRERGDTVRLWPVAGWIVRRDRKAVTQVVVEHIMIGHRRMSGVHAWR